jgi:hypothetical protein
MKSVIKAVAAASAIVCILAASVFAADEGAASNSPVSTPGQKGPSQVAGEWEFKNKMPSRTAMVMMTITRNAEGHYEGKWSTQWQDSNVSDITYENGKMRFIQSGAIRNQRFKTEYETIVDGNKITGKGKNEAGEVSLDGVFLDESNSPAKTGAEGGVFVLQRRQGNSWRSLL